MNRRAMFHPQTISVAISSVRLAARLIDKVLLVPEGFVIFDKLFHPSIHLLYSHFSSNQCCRVCCSTSQLCLGMEKFVARPHRNSLYPDCETKQENPGRACKKNKTNLKQDLNPLYIQREPLHYCLQCV